MLIHIGMMNYTTLFFFIIHNVLSHEQEHSNVLSKIESPQNQNPFVFLHFHSLELLAMPSSWSMLRSSLNLSRTVPLMALCCVSVSFDAWTIPQHSITSGCILVVLDRLGLPNVVHENVWPWSKLADINRPKWLIFPPNPMPFGMFSDVKLVAHCTCFLDNDHNHTLTYSSSNREAYIPIECWC